MGPWPRTEARRRAARWSVALASAAWLALAPPPGDAAEGPVAELAFARHARPVARHDRAALERLAEAATVRVLEPYEGREVAFRALPFDGVLDAIYGPDWRAEEELLFTCRDGYQPTVPVARVLAHRAWLAFDRADQPGFAIRKRESGEHKRVELGPFYLVWENLDDPKIRQEWDYGWPYQLVGVDLIRAAERYPKLAPPEDASASVREGFAAFRIHCSKCHALNGEGGRIGPELNAASSPVEYRDRDWLRDWIEDPSRIRPDARMPALNPELPDRGRTVDAILDYLEAMRSTSTSTSTSGSADAG